MFKPAYVFNSVLVIVAVVASLFCYRAFVVQDQLVKVNSTLSRLAVTSNWVDTLQADSKGLYLIRSTLSSNDAALLALAREAPVIDLELARQISFLGDDIASGVSEGRLDKASNAHLGQKVAQALAENSMLRSELSEAAKIGAGLAVAAIVILALVSVFSLCLIQIKNRLDGALKDKQTGLLNKKAFEALKPQSTDFVVALRLNGFFMLNEQYGHSVGDSVLRLVADIILSSLTKADQAFYLHKNSFCIVLDHIDRDDAILLSEKIRSEIETLCAPHKITASVGVGYDYSIAEANKLLAKYIGKRGVAAEMVEFI